MYEIAAIALQTQSPYGAPDAEMHNVHKRGPHCKD